MLAGIALCVATGILVKQGKLRYAWVTGVPLAWLAIVTTTAAWQKIVSRRSAHRLPRRRPSSWRTSSRPARCRRSKRQWRRS